MAVNVLRRAAITLAVYILALLGILFLQFSNDNGFILSIGTLKINGFERSAQDGTAMPDPPLLVSADGIAFFIDKKTPLAAVLDTGEEIALEMRSFNKGDGAFSIEFDRGVTLSFFPAETNTEEERQGGAVIRAEMPEGISLLRLGYRLDGSASLESVGGALMVCSEGKIYALGGATLEGGFSGGVLPAESRIEIFSQSPSVAYTKYEVLRDVSLETIGKDLSASEEAYSLAVESFAETLSSAYQAAAEAGSLTEQLAAAYLAESGRRGNYVAAVASLPASFLNGGGARSLTAVYAGGTEAAWQLWRQENERELLAYTASLGAGDAAVFEKKSLAAFLIANRRANDFRRLAEIAAVCTQQETLTTRQAAGILELSLDRGLFSQAATEISDEIIAVCEETIRKSLRYFPSFSSVPSALYIEENAGAADTLSALETAAILYRWGSRNAGKADWTAAARLIAMTVLKRAESGDSLPAVITIPDPAGRADAKASEAQDIPLAGIYPLIEPVTSWYPHAEAVYPGYFIWTCAANVSFSLSAEGVIDISAEFPAGQEHYMIVSGMQDFYGIQIHGADYRSDPRFETYNVSGYRYSADEDTIFIKLRHRAGRETIRIFTMPPPPSEPETESSPEAEPATEFGSVAD